MNVLLQMYNVNGYFRYKSSKILVDLLQKFNLNSYSMACFSLLGAGERWYTSALTADPIVSLSHKFKLQVFIIKLVLMVNSKVIKSLKCLIVITYLRPKQFDLYSYN